MAWVPGQSCVGSSVDVTDAQSAPWRFTTAAHILDPWKRPPAVGSDDVRMNCRSCVAVGRFAQLLSCASADIALAIEMSVRVATNLYIGVLLNCEAGFGRY